MPTVSRADVADALSLVLRDPMANQFRQDVPLMHLLEVTRDGNNDALTWNPKFAARSAGGAYAEGADMTDADFDSHDRKKAFLNWAMYRAGAKVSGLAMAVAAGQMVRSVGAGGDLFDEELVDGVDHLANVIGGDLYAGDDSASPTEVAGAIRAITGAGGGVFAGLDPVALPDWVGNQTTDTLAAFIATPAAMLKSIRDNVFRPVKDASGRKPDFVTLDGALMDLLKPTLDDKAEVVQEVRVNGAMINVMQSFGGEAITVDGVPFIEDRHAPTQTMVGWTRRDVKIVQLPAVDPMRDPRGVVAAVKALTGVDIERSDVETQLSMGGMLAPSIDFLSKTGDSDKAMIKVYLQLRWRRRNSHVRFTLT